MSRFGYCKLNIGVFLVIVFWCLIIASNEANAGTIIKAPAYLSLQTGLAGCWSFDGLYNKAPDCSGNNNTATLVNGPTKVQGKVGQALNFVGSSNYVNLGASTLYKPTGTQATMSVWIKSTTGSGAKIIAFQRAAGSSALALVMEFPNAQLFYRDSSNVLKTLSTTITVSDNNWHNFVGVIDGTSAKVYVDGVQSGSATDVDTTNTFNFSSNIATLASLNGAAPFIAGKIDEVRFYHRALSITEIQRLYLIGLGSKENKSITSSNGDLLTKGLIGCWSFDGLYNKAPDCSGNNRTGTLSGENGPPKRVQGKVGQALSFDGVDDAVTGSANIPLPITVNAIFKYRVSGDHQVIFANNSGANDGYRVRINTSNQVAFTLGGVADYNFTNLTVTEDVWYHLSLVVTGNGGTATAYLTPLGGTISSQALSIGTMSGSLSSFQIGTTTGLGDFFKGTLDEIRVYNRVLSVEEIRRLYNQTQSKFNSPQTDSLTHGLVGCWTFDGLYTKAPDCSGNNNTGTLTGGPRKVQGKVGQALSFDGVDDYVDLGSPTTLDNLSSGPVTYSVWVYLDSLTGSDCVICPSNVSSNFVNGIGLFTPGTPSRWAFRRECATNDLQVETATGTTVAGRWQHVVAIWDGSVTASNVRIYLDGVEYPHTASDVSCNGGFTTDNTAAISIGRNNGDNSYINGRLDEVRVYNRALSVGEVQKLYNMGR